LKGKKQTQMVHNEEILKVFVSTTGVKTDFSRVARLSSFGFWGILSQKFVFSSVMVKNKWVFYEKYLLSGIAY